MNSNNRYNKKSSDKSIRVNYEIRVPEVRLIDSNGDQLGIVKTRIAIEMASEKNLDLVEISPTANPPVCKIMDFGKHLYEIRKRKSEAKKTQKQTQLKEVKFRPVTEIGDYQVKLKKIQKFVENGDKVKVTLKFKGREVTHQDLGYQLLLRVKNDLQDMTTVESAPKKDGKLQMVMVLIARKK
jgi:translation initiation factor IF-3